jgi:hypothetical protein
MSTKKQRQRFREKRMAFDRAVEESRAEKEKAEMLDNMTKAELIEYAEANGIEIDKTAKKAEILGKLK